MKDILYSLLKEYYKLGLVQKKVVIIGEGAKQQIHIIDALMPLEWNMTKNDGKPDIEAAKTFIDGIRKMRAEQLFRRTYAILKYKNMLELWAKEYGKVTPNLSNSPPHEELVQWAEGALYFLDVITPFDYVEMSSIVDEKGIFQGQQLHPNEKHDPTEGALEAPQ